MLSKKLSKTVLKLLHHKKKFDASLNDIINKNYSLKTTTDVGLWWIFGY